MKEKRREGKNVPFVLLFSYKGDRCQSVSATSVTYFGLRPCCHAYYVSLGCSNEAHLL